MWFLLACHPPENPVKGTETPTIHAADGRIYDLEGRVLLLRGVNARVDGLFDVDFSDGRVALETIPPFTAEDCRFLAEDLGLDLLRLPVNWSAIEPEKGSYDDAYLDRVVALVDDCEAAGVYTLVDLHQDAYSKEIGEDGAPLWAIVPAPAELLEGPLTDLGTRRTSPEVLAAFGSLYANTDGLTDAYAAMSAHVAARIEGHAVGLELQNEPVPLGNIDALDNFHATMVAAVREAAPTLMVAFEPDSLRNITDAATVRAPFPDPNALYAPHTYVDVFEGEPGSAEAIVASLQGVVAEAGQHGATPWIGEWGANPTEETGLQYSRDALSAFDQFQLGWAYWVYEEWSQGSWGLYDAEGEMRGGQREEIATLLARPYPLAIDGTVEEFTWDGTSLHLSVSKAGSGEQIVAAPTRLWPDGPTVRCDGEEVPVNTAGGRARFHCAGSNWEIF